MPSSCARKLYVSCKCKQNLSLSETEHYFRVSSPDDKCQILLFIFPTRLLYCFPLWLMRFSLWGWLRKICILQWTRWDHHHKQYSYLDKNYLSAPPPLPHPGTILQTSVFQNTCSLEQFLLHKNYNSLQLDLSALFLLKCYWSDSQNNSKFIFVVPDIYV